MKVCLFGSYVKDSYGIPSGNGGTLLKKILETQNIKVIECHEPLEKWHAFIQSYVKLLSKHKKIDYDIMLVPWRGILTLPLAKLIHKKPIIYFPAFSIYDTLVNDRKKIKKNSLKARFVHFVDALACKWVDKVALESTAEINYFVEEFGLPREKFFQLPLAADESLFQPTTIEESNEKFTVLFFGSFIPLHGIDTITKTAILLKEHKDIFFSICGDGQTKPEIEKLIQKNDLKNIKLVGLVSKDELLEQIRKSDLCLGIFGKSIKARKVLTNKAFQILSSKKPLITMDSPAVREANLKNKENCMLVTPANPERLAEAILFLKNDSKKRQEIAEKGYENYSENLSMNQVGKRLVKVMQDLEVD